MRVIYGFGNNDYIESNLTWENTKSIKDVFIGDGVCFSSFISARFERNCPGSVYYLIRTNLELLKDAIGWLNSINSGFSISIIRNKHSGCLIGAKTVYENYVPKTTYSDFATGNNFKFESGETPPEFKTLDVDDILVKIDTDNSFSDIARTYMEYLLLVVLRILDPFDRPGYIRYFKQELTIQENIVNGSNLSEDWHSIYKSAFNMFTVDDLIDSLNISSIEKFKDYLTTVGNDITGCQCSVCIQQKNKIKRYKSVMQTGIIDLVLGRTVINETK